MKKYEFTGETKETFYTHKKIIMEAAALKWGVDL